MTQRRFGRAPWRSREKQEPARPSVVPGPTHRNPQALAAELRELAAHPRAGSHGAALRELADSVARGSGLEVWAGGGLVAAYGGPDALAPGPDEDAARGRRLGSLPTVLVFVPLLITWFGLGAAAWAYQRMRDSGSTAQGSFLTLWQQGFDGRLWPVLRFDMMALWTVLALSALATATLMRHRWEERDESERRVLSQRLSGALVQTQALAAGAAAASPGRFTAELQSAAERLRDLLGQAATVQQCARDLIVQADGAAGRSVAATAALDSAAEALRSGTQQIRASAQTASAAAEQVAAGSRLLAESVDSAVTTLRTSVTESLVTAGRDAARLIGAAGESVASRFDTVAAAADERGTVAAGHAAESMDRVGREVRDALTAARGSFAESTQLLGSAVNGLDRSLTTLPSSLESSASEGAERIGMAYELAVAALSASLRQEVRAVSAELGDRVEELREAVADRQTTEQDLRAGRTLYEAQLGAAVAEFHDTVRALTKALREAGPAVSDGARHRAARTAEDGPRAGADAPVPDLHTPTGPAPDAPGAAAHRQDRSDPSAPLRDDLGGAPRRRHRTVPDPGRRARPAGPAGQAHRCGDGVDPRGPGAGGGAAHPADGSQAQRTALRHGAAEAGEGGAGRAAAGLPADRAGDASGHAVPGPLGHRRADRQEAHRPAAGLPRHRGGGVLRAGHLPQPPRARERPHDPAGAQRLAGGVQGRLGVLGHAHRGRAAATGAGQRRAGRRQRLRPGQAPALSQYPEGPLPLEKLLPHAAEVNGIHVYGNKFVAQREDGIVAVSSINAIRAHKLPYTRTSPETHDRIRAALNDLDPPGTRRWEPIAARLAAADAG